MSIGISIVFFNYMNYFKMNTVESMKTRMEHRVFEAIIQLLIIYLDIVISSGGLL